MSCSSSERKIEGIILDIKKGGTIGEFIYIEIESDRGNIEKLY